MQLSKFIAGLQILAPYFDGGDGHHTGAEHDQFYVYATDKPLSSEDVTKMNELGWFQAETYNNDTEENGPYDPEEGWTCYT